MTLPDERYNAVLRAQEFLRSLLDRKATPRVPQEIRIKAYSVLKHFPKDYELDAVAKKCPEVFKK